MNEEKFAVAMNSSPVLSATGQFSSSRNQERESRGGVWSQLVVRTSDGKIGVLWRKREIQTKFRLTRERVFGVAGDAHEKMPAIEKITGIDFKHLVASFADRGHYSEAILRTRSAVRLE
jgi:hypothetical protein